MNLRALRTLVEIERVGGFARAADRLGLTLSAVSLQMKTLEEELQLSLFDRSQRPAAMTPAGRRVAAHARAMLEEADAIRAVSAGEGADRLHGDYRIGFVATASVRLAPGFLAAGRRRHPTARFAAVIDLSAPLMAQLRAGALDAAVLTRTPDLGPDLALTHLRREPFALAAPVQSGAAPVLAHCVGALAFVQFAPATGIGLLAAQHMRRLGAVPHERIVLDSVEAVMECVNSGVGFALLPEPDVRRYAAAGVSIAPEPGLARDLVLATRAASPLTALSEALAALFEGVGEG